MVVAEKMKPTIKVSLPNTTSSSDEESEGSERELSSSDENNEADAESVSSLASDNEEDENNVQISNVGWADSVAKILGANKPKNKKSLVLSRAKKHSDIVKKEKVVKPAFEVIGEEKEEKPEVKAEASSEPPVKKIKQEKPSLRIKPNILEKDRERLLAKIATKGVVQLFNAVRNQQKTLERETERTDLSEVKKERLLKKFDKRAFLDTLMGQSKSVVVDEQVKSTKDEVKGEDSAPKWSALRDDFMTGAKMKDWDKESVDE